MGRKSIGILTVLILFCLVAGWYYFTRESKYFNTSAFKAVPPNSPVIIKVQKISALSSKASGSFISKEFSTLPGVHFFTGELHLIDSLFHADPAAQKYLEDKSILLAYGGKENLSLLYLVELSDMAEKTAIKNLVNEYFLKRKAVKASRRKEAALADIYYWSSGPDYTTFSVSFYKGVFIAGTDPDRVLEAANQIDQPSIEQDSVFQKIYKTASPTADLNVYLKRQSIPKLIEPLFTSDFLHRINHSPKSKWTEIDIELKEKELLFNGFTMPADSLKDYKSVLAHQESSNFDLYKHLPAETSAFFCLNLKNSSAYFSDYEQMLTKNGELNAYQNLIIETDTLYGVNIQNLVKENLAGEAGIFYTHFDTLNPVENRFLIMKIQNEKHLDSLMLKLVRPVIPGKWIKFRGVTQDFKMGKDTLIKMYQIPVPDFGERVFGKIFSQVPTSYFTICDSCLIMSSSFTSLEEYLRSVFLNETLDKDATFQNYISGSSLTSSIFLWLKPTESLPFFGSDLNPGLYRKLANQLEELKRIESFGWVMSAEKKMIYNSGRLIYRAETRNRPLAIWKFKSDNPVLQPQLVLNPENKNNPDAIVQDKAYNLYLISSSGHLIWKKKLSSQILSKIYQVNYFRDRRVQFLFNTADAIHLIDREGKYIPGYPVKLKSRATNGIGVFDYDKTLDYRIFVACEDKNSYAFDRNGMPISGWAPAPTEDIVTKPIQFFRVMGKDYIVYSDKGRTYIMDRKGNERVKLQENISPSINNTIILEPGDSANLPAMITTQKDGTICILNFDGSVKKKVAGRFSDQHHFMGADLNHDGLMEYIFLDGNNLSVYDREGKNIFTRKFINQIDRAPSIIETPDQGLKIAISDGLGKNIYLINPDGSTCSGFPIEGNSIVDSGIFNPEIRRFNLLTGSSDGFLYNYILK